MKLHFTIVTAGVWQCDERPEIQVRKVAAGTQLGTDVRGGWAVFVNGIELLTVGREQTKRYAVENAEAYADRADKQLARMTAEADRQLTAQREYEQRTEVERLADLNAVKANGAAQAAADQRERVEHFETVNEREERLDEVRRERHAGELLALAGVTAATHIVKFDGTIMPREGIPCAHPEAARVKSRDVWHPDTCGGCGNFVPDADATPTLGPAPERPAPIREALERVTRAAYEAVEAALAAQQDAPPAADPATEDDSNELLDRIVRRAQYTALHEVLSVLDGWIEGNAVNAEGGVGEVEAIHRFHSLDIRRMVNDAARELRVPEPFRDEAAR